MAINFENVGAYAFRSGHGRFAPLDVLLGEGNNKTIEQGIKDADAWFRGWDRANLDASIPGWTKDEMARLRNIEKAVA